MWLAFYSFKIPL